MCLTQLFCIVSSKAASALYMYVSTVYEDVTVNQHYLLNQ